MFVLCFPPGVITGQGNSLEQKIQVLRVGKCLQTLLLVWKNDSSAKSQANSKNFMMMHFKKNAQDC